MGDHHDEFVLEGYEPFNKCPEISLGEFIHRRLRDANSDEIIIDVLTEERSTYGDLRENTIKLAHCLRKCGYKKGDVFSVCSENSVRYGHPVIASLYIGATVAPFNPSYTHAEILHALHIARPKLIFCSSDCLEKVLEAKRAVDFVERVIVMDDEGDAETVTSFVRRNLGDDFYIESFEPVPADLDEVAFVVYSSGTSGLAKGVMLTHRNFNISIIHFTDPQVMLHVKNDVVFSILPMFHIYGLSILLAAIVDGLRVAILAKFDEKLFLQTIQDYRVRTLWLVPPLFVVLAKSPRVNDYDLSSLKQAFCGAAPLGREVEALFKARLNVQSVRQGFGLTETAAAALVMPVGETKPGSVGKVLSYMSLKIVDLETGTSLGSGRSGEICLKGGQVMKGYYKNQLETDNCVDEKGWFHTGDIGHYDEEGYVFVTDRLKELIKYKGFQVPPAELETLLLTNPKIKDAGVIGVPHPEAGELPLAFVVKMPGSAISEKEVRDFVAGNVSPQKQLRGGVRFVDAIPKSQSGKILRRELRGLL